METPPLHPVTVKKLKRAEMMKHFDSHHHLCRVYGEKNLRPVIVEVPLKGSTGEDACRVDNSMLSVVAALASEKTILITDMSVMHGVETSDVNITYLVHNIPQTIEPMEVTEGDLVKAFYHVKTIEEALAHIKAKLTEVSEKADLKDPFSLGGLLWSYMAAREIRVVGHFKHVSMGLKHSNILQVCYPATSTREIFTAKTIGARSYAQNNTARTMQVYADHPNDFQLEQGLNQHQGDPYFNLAYQNAHSTVEGDRLDVKLVRHAKNKMGRYQKEAIRDLPNEVVIIGRADYLKMKIEHAAVIVIDPNPLEHFQEDSFVTGNLVFPYPTMYQAIVSVIDRLRTRPTAFDKHTNAIRLSYAKTIHVFTDVIEEAY